MSHNKSKTTSSTQDNLGICTPKVLPTRLLVEAAETARRVFPANAPSRVPPGQSFVSVLEPQQIAVLTTKYWGPQQRRLTVSFMERPANDLKQRILQHMNAWSQRCGISFVLTNGTGNVRISLRGDGYWSYLGTDVLHIPRNQATMSLQSFSMRTSESEYRRVVRHETGHTLGFPHEHMRRAIVDLLDPNKTIAWMARNYGWDAQTVREQVLTPLDERSLMATPPDVDSIMCYQLAGDCTKSGQPIPGGYDIDESDYSFASRIYPKQGRDPSSTTYLGASQEGEENAATEEMETPMLVVSDWPEEQDPEIDLDSLETGDESYA